MTDFDVVILGGGSGGYAGALRASQLGLTVGLIEKDKLGGTCLHWGCIPTKALLHAAEIADAVRESGQFGVNASLEGVDLHQVNAYKDGVVDRLYKGLQGLIKSRGITVIEGHGRMIGPHTVDVDGTRFEGLSLVLASGSVTKTLPGLEIDGERVLSSSEAMQLDAVPERAIVLGGGVIGVEFASAWRSFGADVTIIEALPRLVATEDPASSRVLERALRKRGVKVSTNTRFAGVERTESGVR
ncbi:MAG: FAD-dependent oxidoreductase, partial [Nocardioidaceae bacterium]|nr:FAD-dependent oxidoreductase [Nocardioidaceae bacterium]